MVVIVSVSDKEKQGMTPQSSVCPPPAVALELDARSESEVRGAPPPGKESHVGCFMRRKQRLCK